MADMKIDYDTDKVILEISLPGKPYSTNSLYRFSSRGMYMTSKGTDTKNDYIYQLKPKSPPEPYEGDCELVIDLFFDTHHRRDWDNYNKIACDAIEDAGILKDDSQIQTGVVRKHYDKEDPRMEITLIACEET